jgi:hypothetical protein
MASQTTVPVQPVEQTRCYLLELPPELRLHTYEYVFAGAKVRCALLRDGENFEFPLGPPIDRGITALLRCCRQVLTESQPVLYRQIQFKILIRGRLGQCKEEVESEFRKTAEFLVPLMHTIEIHAFVCMPNTSSAQLKMILDFFLTRGSQGKDIEDTARWTLGEGKNRRYLQGSSSLCPSICAEVGECDCTLKGRDDVQRDVA